jgi:hypothetical protein
MRAAFAIAALVGSAIAAPSYPTYEQEEVKNVHLVVETVVQTIYVTEGYEIPSPTPKTEAVKPTPAPAKPTITAVYEAPKPSQVYEEPAKSSAVYEAPAVSSAVYEAPAPIVTPTPTPAPAPAPSAPTNSGYMGIVDEWRAKMGMKALSQDSKLESNAMDTVVSSNGQMVHKLNPGTYGQVLAPGSADKFESVFVGGWLCEMPSLPGLDGICSTMSQGWSYEGQTGHAEILTSDNYSKIGCALHEGIWCCDLA